MVKRSADDTSKDSIDLDSLSEADLRAMLEIVEERDQTLSSMNGRASLRHIVHQGKVSASQIQERFYFLYKLNPLNSGSNSHFLIKINASINEDWLQQSAESIVNKYD